MLDILALKRGARFVFVGCKGIYLDPVATLRPSKSYGLVGGVVVVVVAHKILVSAQGPLVFGIWVWGLGVWGPGLTI